MLTVPTFALTAYCPCVILVDVSLIVLRGKAMVWHGSLWAEAS